MNMLTRLLILSTLALAGCGKEEAKKPVGAVEGEILPRSVGDDMLPYDTLQSQPPLAPRARDSRDKEDGGDKPGSSDENSGSGSGT